MIERREELRGPAGSLVLVEESRDLPLARLTVTLRDGSAGDPPGGAGLAAFSAELARRGAAGLGRQAIDERLESLGADLDVSIEPDCVTFDVEVLSRNVREAAALLADIVLRPDWPRAEAAKLRRETLAEIDELRDDDAQLARRFFQRRLYGAAHPYGHPMYGEQETVPRLDERRARDWLERALEGGRLIFGAAGDLSAAEFRAIVERRFGAVRSGGAPPAPPPAPPFPRGLKVLLVDKPERTQSQILIGHPAPRWADPDFLPLAVATCAFGGTFTARLMTEVRVKRGLSYGASCRAGQGAGQRPIAIAVAPSLEQTPETIELVLGLWRDWVERGVTDEEIAFAKGYLAQSFAFQIATPEERLDLALSTAVCGLPRDYAERRVAEYEAVEPAAVRAAMARCLRRDDLIVTIVTTARELRPKIAGKIVPKDAIEVVQYDAF